MSSPAVLDQVRASGRGDDFVVVRVDHLAPVVNICHPVEKPSVEKPAPSSPLSGEWESHVPETVSSVHDQRIAVVQDVLRSTFVHLNKSHHAIADLKNLIRATVRAIEVSQQMIVESDGVIARAQCGYR